MNDGEENYRICKAQNRKRKFCRNRCNDDVCNSNTKRYDKKMCQKKTAFGAKWYMKKYEIKYRWAQFRCGTCRLITTTTTTTAPNNLWIIN